jgi:hypothetical protein
MEPAVLVTVFHQCTADKHNKVCAPAGKPSGRVKVKDSMPKGNGDVVYELHLLSTEMAPVDGDDHAFEVDWEIALRRPFQVYTR